MIARNIHPAARKSRRAVWAAITADPRAAVRDLAQSTGYVTDTVVQALRDLENLGYIERHGARATVVRVPLRERP